MEGCCGHDTPVIARGEATKQSPSCWGLLRCVAPRNDRLDGSPIAAKGIAMSLSLDGVRVLELARYQAGPRGGMILSDLGAEVIKIEKLGGEETRKSEPVVRGQSVYFSVYNRGKKSLCLDLRHPRGKEI